MTATIQPSQTDVAATHVAPPRSAVLFGLLLLASLTVGGMLLALGLNYLFRARGRGVDPQKWGYDAHWWMNSIATYGALVTVAMSALAKPLVRRYRKSEPTLRPKEKGLILAFWIIAPPLWFLIEYYAFFRIFEHFREDEHIRHFHELARNLWIAVVVLLTALYNNRLPGAAD